MRSVWALAVLRRRWYRCPRQDGEAACPLHPKTCRAGHFSAREAGPEAGLLPALPAARRACWGRRVECGNRLHLRHGQVPRAVLRVPVRGGQVLRPRAAAPLGSQVLRPRAAVPLGSQVLRPRAVVPLGSQVLRPRAVVPLESQVQRRGTSMPPVLRSPARRGRKVARRPQVAERQGTRGEPQGTSRPLEQPQHSAAPLGTTGALRLRAGAQRGMQKACPEASPVRVTLQGT